MELLALLVLATVGLVLVGSIAGLVAASRLSGLDRRVEALDAAHTFAMKRIHVLERELFSPASEGVGGSPARGRAPAESVDLEPGPDICVQVELAQVEIEPVAAPAPAQVAQAAPAETAPVEATPAAPAETSVVAEPAQEPGPEATPPWAQPEGAAIEPGDWWRRFEERAGKRWTTWVGALALFAGAVFFVKLAVDQGWLGPWGRVAIALAAGAGLVTGGVGALRRGMRPLGQGLVGGGLAVLYAAIYASHAVYHLVPQVAAFAVMALVTALGMGLAVWREARPIAFLAVAGGLATPLVLWPDRDPGAGLFAYLLCLDLGVLGVALHRRWRALDVLAMVGTWSVFGLWHREFFVPGELAAPLLWLAAFHLVFLAIPFAFHLRHGTRVARERLAMALASGCGVFAYAASLLLPGHPHVLGAVAIALGASFLAVAGVMRRRVPTDGNARLSLITLAVAFFTLAAPIHLDYNAVTIVWAMEGVLLLILGFRYRYLPDRVFGLLVFAFAAGRVIALEWPHAAAAPWLDADFGAALVVALAGGAIALVIRVFDATATPAERVVKTAVALGAAFLALGAVTSELWFSFARAGAPWIEAERWASALIWVAGGAALLGASVALRSFPARLATLAALVVAIGFLVWDYALGWPAGQLVVLNGRFLASVAVLAAMGLVVAATLRSADPEPVGAELITALVGLGFLLAPVLLSTELWQWSRVDLSRALVTVSWLAAAGAAVALSHRWAPADDLRWLGPLHFVTAAVIAAAWFGHDLVPGAFPAIWNLRFATALVVGAAVVAYGLWLVKPAGEHDEERVTVGVVALGAGVVALGLAASAEAWDWAALTIQGRGVLCVLIAAIWVAASAAFLGAGVRLDSTGLQRTGFAALVAAGVAGAIGYGFPLWPGSMLVLNGRFVAPGLVVAMAFVFGAIIRHRAEPGPEGDEARREGRTVLGVGTALVVALLSVETYLYFVQTVADPERARWLAQTGLSIVWSLSAVAVVVAGFWRRRRALRLAGLGLFAATALKLLAVDMAQVAGGYRVASFVVVGVLMIGASYLYHRVERWVESAGSAPDGASPAR